MLRKIAVHYYLLIPITLTKHEQLQPYCKVLPVYAVNQELPRESIKESSTVCTLHFNWSTTQQFLQKTNPTTRNRKRQHYNVNHDQLACDTMQKNIPYPVQSEKKKRFKSPTKSKCEQHELNICCTLLASGQTHKEERRSIHFYGT